PELGEEAHHLGADAVFGLAEGLGDLRVRVPLGHQVQQSLLPGRKAIEELVAVPPTAPGALIWLLLLPLHHTTTFRPASRTSLERIPQALLRPGVAGYHSAGQGQEAQECENDRPCTLHSPSPFRTRAGRIVRP